jgi:hypothetical protein
MCQAAENPDPRLYYLIKNAVLVALAALFIL